MKKLSFAHIKTYLLAPLYIAGVVWVVLLGFDWVATYFEHQEQPEYQFVAEDLKLKSAPKDVIHSEAFTTASGTDVVKYAYLAGEVGSQLNEDIQRRTPVSYTEVINQFKDENDKPMETLKTTFLSSPQFYQDGGKWRQIEYATTTPDVFSMSGAIPYIKRRELAERIVPGAPVYALTSTFYPDPNVETSSVDGDIVISTDSFGCDFTAWDQATGGGLGIPTDNGGTVFVYVQYIDNGDCTDAAAVARGFLLFNTAALGSSATISAASISIYVTNKYTGSNDGWDLVYVDTVTTSSNTSLLGGDYGNVSTVSQATAVDITSITTSTYTALTFNSTGRSNISKTGVSKFGIREGHDFDNAVPGSGAGASGVGFSAAETAGTSQDPKLEVTYTVPSTFSFGQWFPF